MQNSTYLFSSNTVSSGLTTIQGILAAVILGPKDYGILGLIITFASNVNRLLSFRMGELVIKFGGAYLESGEKNKAASVIKLAGYTEIISSIIAYLLLLLTAPLASKFILKNPDLSKWIMIYGVALLANFVTETSTAILQLANKYKTIAAFNLAQNIVTAIWIVVLFIMNGNLFQVLLAYLVGKFIFGFGIFLSGIIQLKSLVGDDWRTQSVNQVENKWEIVKFAFSTNLSGTVNLLIRDSEVLWFGYFWSSEIVGYYKFGLAILNPIMMPINTLITTTYPEINRLISQKLWNPLRNLIKKTTLISLLWTGSCTLGLILLGDWLLSFIKDGKYLPSLPITLVLLIGYGCANILFWNRNLLLAFNRPNTPLFIMGIFGVIKIVVMLVTVPKFGYLYQAGLLSAYFVFSIGLISLLGWMEIPKSSPISATQEV
ncbi:MAG: lipopolysaccharide biosynthesis protein [Anaerolineaceae bacterium]